MIEIGIESPDQPDVALLLESSDAYMALLYPAESNHLLDIDSLKRPEVTFLVARIDGRALGCGAVVDSGEGWAEIKRMFVSPTARGRRLGKQLLSRIESIAADFGATLIRLETGAKQPEALSLYHSAGYVEIAAFGDYLPDPFSIFMEKPVAGAVARGPIC
jgi:putative acetyltransferase